MTEAQKYEGALYKEKPQKGNNKQNKKQPDHSKTLTNTNGNSANTKKPRHPYVEDAPDADDPPSKQVPPPAPSPPPTTAATAPASKPKVAAPTEKDDVNVFDFLVPNQTPTASKISLAGSKEQMTMVTNARSIFEPSKAMAQYDTDLDDEDREYDIAYEENGFSYGADPIKPSPYGNQVSNVSMDFMTPAPKKKKEKKHRKKDSSPDPEPRTTSDKKRKRGHVEELDVAAANARYEEDTPMTDAPSSVANNVGTPFLQHSGLTGGLDRMLRDGRSPSPDYEDYTDDEHDLRRYQDPHSPLKRTRPSGKSAKNADGDDGGLGISLKGRAGRIISMFGGSNVSTSSRGSAEPPSKTLVRTRRSPSSNGDHAGALVQVRRSKKTPNVRLVRTAADGDSARKTKRKISSQSNGNDYHDAARPSRRLKAIEYRGSDSGAGNDDNRKMVVYRHDDEALTEEEMERDKALYFLSLVTKGPESGRGCSINKALKRFHRDFPAARIESPGDHDNDKDSRGRGRSSRADRDRRLDEEKDLWRTLRLRRNDRGEIVVFI
jgi:cell growth-regulating nucleolar protein